MAHSLVFEGQGIKYPYDRQGLEHIFRTFCNKNSDRNITIFTVHKENKNISQEERNKYLDSHPIIPGDIIRKDANETRKKRKRKRGKNKNKTILSYIVVAAGGVVVGALVTGVISRTGRTQTQGSKTALTF